MSDAGETRTQRRHRLERLRENRLERMERLRRDHTLVEHGTENAYKNWYCRCDKCREAHRAYQHHARTRWGRKSRAASADSGERGGDQ